MLDQVLALLSAAAAAGRPCPSNLALARALGIKASGATVYFKRLVARGAITITQSGPRGRVVAIVATGQQTAALAAVERRRRAAAVATPAPAEDPAIALAVAAAPPAEDAPADEPDLPVVGLLPPAPATVRFACRSIGEIPAHQLRTGCAWPEGDMATGVWSYCNAPPIEGRSWCLEHARRAFRPPAEQPGRAR